MISLFGFDSGHAKYFTPCNMFDKDDVVYFLILYKLYTQEEGVMILLMN